MNEEIRNICPHCECAVAEKDTFCHNCGQLSGVAEQKPEEGWWHPLKKWAIIIGAVLLSLGIISSLLRYAAEKQERDGSTYVSEVSSDQPLADGDYIIEGKIGTYDVEGIINVNGGSLTGKYKYPTSTEYLELKGEIQSNGEVTIEEFTSAGNKCGDYKGRVDEDVIKGDFTNFKNDEFEFKWSLRQTSDVVAEAAASASAAAAAASEALAEEVGPAYEGDYVVVDGVNVRLRTSPYITDNNIVTDYYGNPVHPSKGERLEYRGEEGDFYLVDYGGDEYYISKKHSYRSN